MEVVVSIAYSSAKTRISYFVQVHYEGEGTYVVRIEHYLKVVNCTNGDVLRLAIADLYKAEVIEGCSGQYLQVRRPLTNVSRKSYPMAVDDIGRKLVWGDATKSREEYKLILWRFTPYSNTYVKRDPNLA